MAEYFDADETRDPLTREAALFGRLPEFIAYARKAAPGWARHLHETGHAPVASREALAALPLLRKSDLPEMQKSDPPFGGFVTGKPVARIMISPGPIHEPQAAAPDPWRLARALFAAGFRAATSSTTPSPIILPRLASCLTKRRARSAAPVIPAGTGNTEQQAEVASRRARPDPLMVCASIRL